MVMRRPTRADGSAPVRIGFAGRAGHADGPMREIGQPQPQFSRSRAGAGPWCRTRRVPSPSLGLDRHHKVHGFRVDSHGRRFNTRSSSPARDTSPAAGCRAGTPRQGCSEAAVGMSMSSPSLDAWQRYCPNMVDLGERDHDPGTQCCLHGNGNGADVLALAHVNEACFSGLRSGIERRRESPALQLSPTCVRRLNGAPTASSQ